MICKKCGKEIPDYSKFCSFCGENQEIQNAGQTSSDQAQTQDTSSAQASAPKVILAHRGTMTLVFGIIGIVTLFCCCPGIFSIIAIVIGTGDLKKMKMGFMDPAGEGTTKAGIILGIIGLALLVIIIISSIVLSVVNGGTFWQLQKFNRFRGLMP
jgi:hypothetical protein